MLRVVVRDELDAATLDAAIVRLRDQGLLPLTVHEAKSGFLRGGFGQPLFSKRRALSRRPSPCSLSNWPVCCTPACRWIGR